LINGYNHVLNAGKSQENLAKITESSSQSGLNRTLNRAKSIGGAIWSSATGGLSLALNGMNKSDSTFRKSRWGILMSHASMDYSTDDAKLYRLAGLMLNDKGDNLSLIDFEGRDWLVNEYNSLSDSKKSAVRAFADKIQSTGDTVVFGSDGNTVLPNSIDWNNYHKAGLNFVPKENYKALLHRGEMVLNAEQAEQYRKALNIDRYGNALGNYMGGDADSTPRAKGVIKTGYPWVMTAGYPSYPSRRIT